MTVKDKVGNTLNYQMISVEKFDAIDTYGQVVQRFIQKNRINCVLQLKTPLPAHGYETLQIEYGTEERIEPPSGVFVEENTLENEFSKVTLYTNGTIDIFDKETGHLSRGLHYFADVGDAGDVYEYVKPVNDLLLDSRQLVWLIQCTHNGPLYSAFSMETQMRVPKSLSTDKKSRSSVLVNNKIVVSIELTAGKKGVQVRLRIDNQAKDHLLKLVIPMDVDSEYVHADTPYYVASRHAQEFPEAHSLQSFVDVHDSSRGLAVLTTDIKEFKYNLTKKELELYVLKCQDTLYRQMISGSHETFSQSQCEDSFEYQYTLYPHALGWKEANLPQKALSIQTATLCEVTGKHTGELASDFSLFQLTPSTMVLEASKLSEDQSSLVLRMFNPDNKDLATTVAFGVKLLRVEKVRLDEEFIEDIAINSGGNSLEVIAKPYEIITLKVALPLKQTLFPLPI